MLFKDLIPDKAELPILKIEESDAEEVVSTHFPFKDGDGNPLFRDHQLESIKRAITTDKKFVVINAPVGYGKTVAAYVFSKAFGTGAYITHQKALQEQILNERWPGVASLKGANSYSCIYANDTQRSKVARAQIGEVKCGFDDTSKDIQMCNTSKPQENEFHKLFIGKCGSNPFRYFDECAIRMRKAFHSYSMIGKSFRECTSMDLNSLNRLTDDKLIESRFRNFFNDMYSRCSGYWESVNAEIPKIDIVDSFMCNLGPYECPKKSATMLMKMASVRVFNPDLYAIFKRYGIHQQLICNNAMVFDEAHAIEDIIQRIYRLDVPLDSFNLGIGVDMSFLSQNTIDSAIRFNNVFEEKINPIFLISKVLMSEYDLLLAGKNKRSISDFELTRVMDFKNFNPIFDLKKYASSLESKPVELNLLKDIVIPALSTKNHYYKDMLSPKDHAVCGPADYRVVNAMNMYRAKCCDEAGCDDFSDCFHIFRNVKTILNLLESCAVKAVNTYHTGSDAAREYKDKSSAYWLLVDQISVVKKMLSHYHSGLNIVYKASKEIAEENRYVPFIFNKEDQVPETNYGDRSLISMYISANLKPDEKTGYISIVPVNTALLMDRTFYSSANKILMMSGTWIHRHKLFESFGVPENDVEYIEVPPIFKSDMRPVIAIDKPDYMNFSEKVPKNRQVGGIYYKYQTMEGIKSWISQLDWEIRNLRKFIEVNNGVESANIILHASTISIRNLIVQHMVNVDHKWIVQSPNARYHTMQNLENGHTFSFIYKDDLIDYLKENQNRGITLVCYSMNEGVDFKGGAARGQIIVKCPTPNFGDPYVQARVKGSEVAGVWPDDDYFNRKIFTTLTQQYGRVVRSVDDWGYTLLFDQEITKRMRAACHPYNIKRNEMDGLGYLISGIKILNPKLVKFNQLQSVI